MTEREHPEHSNDDQRIDQIVREGPRGALAVAGIAVAIVIGMWFLFYFFAFLPRGTLH
jgi:hypothetical protein